MAGPTTAGSIDAKLTIDKSEWNQERDEAKRDAVELGALNPEIKVDANVGPALAKLAAVAKAERDLETAYMRSTIAQEKLGVITKKHGEDSLQAASARLALKRALDAEADSETKLAAAKGKSTVEHERSTESVNRAANAHRRHISGLQVLLAMSPAIIAAAAPVAGAAVGLGAAFGIMAVSGVIAIKGIKDEMEKGSETGNKYAAGLGSLKANLDSLGGTAADRMLGSFNRTIGDINTRMPAFTIAVGDGSAALGNMGGTALRNVLDGLGAMSPLLKAGAVELSGFVSWLTRFSEAQGFQAFVSYATANLPPVMGMIEKLVTLGGNILAAFAPLGPVVIGFISGTADALNSVPLPVLAGIVTTAVLIGPALRIAFAPGVAALIISVAQAIGLTGVMANLAVPVVGVLTAVIAGIGVAAATSAIGTAAGAQALQDYGDAVERDNGLIGENVRLQAAHAATTKEMRDAADSLGISTETVLRAMLGEKDALDTVNGSLTINTDRINASQRSGEAMIDTATRLTEAKKTLTGGIESNSGSIRNNIDAYHAYKDVVGSTTDALTDEAVALQASASQYGVSVAVYQQASDAQDKAKLSTEGQTVALQLQNDAAGLLRQAWDLLNGSVLSLDQANTRSAAATNSLTASFQQNGLAITGTSEAVVANQQALQNKVATDQAVAEAVAKATGKTEEGTAAFAAAKEQLEKNLSAQGLLTAEVQTYIDKLYTIPATVPKTKVEIDTATAEAQLLALTKRRTMWIDAIVQRSELPDLNGAEVSGSGRMGSYQHGGQVNYLAGGGVPAFRPIGTDTVPAMLTPDEFVMKRASSKSIGLPALNYMNQTGELPPTQQAAGAQISIELNVHGAESPRAAALEAVAELKWELKQAGVDIGQ
ncbi:hypothetical protein [Arthrobacter sp. YN]|uniref:hypothetical protein n=1 Tax=Arthrobacter sp. YN TaxID=2020486 RepID=UPI000B5F6BC0|nr:hypothetical protein [Arthrobacter sp. YN]ASN20704.1 hypothetical protein CGK93_14205 [Arthrobacter sp. YN]